MLAAEGHVVTIEVKFLSHYGTRTIIPAKKNRRRLSIAYRWQLASRRSVLQIPYQPSIS